MASIIPSVLIYLGPQYSLSEEGISTKFLTHEKFFTYGNFITQ